MTNTNNTTKVTNVMALALAIEVLGATPEYAEYVTKLQNIKASTEKKNSNRKSALDLGSALATTVLSTITKATSPISCKAIRESLNDNTITSQKLVPILKAFEESGQIKSSKVKGVAYYEPMGE